MRHTEDYDKIVDILMDRDGLTKEEAESMLDECIDIMDGSPYEEWEEIFMDYIGLELDYLINLFL